LGFFVLAIVVAGAAAGLAAADPGYAPKSTPITITCGNTTYHAVVNGKGVWSPAHDLNSNSIVIPVSFGDATNVFTDPSGTITTSTTPGTAKGSSAPNGAPLLNCSYHLALSFPDGSSLVIDGPVTGFITPANK
jgi:hypothetical protein